MSKTVLTIGFSLAGANSESFRGKASLLDWDIILFRPDISDFALRATERYQGMPCLSDDESFKLRDCCEHWRRQIKEAVEHNKVVIAFLPHISEVSIATGTIEFSGTGRNRQRIRHVETFSNYRSLPTGIEANNAVGKEMKLVPQGAEVLAAYWDEFGSASEYKVLWEGGAPGTCITTRVGNKAAGAILRSKGSLGALVMLPEMEFAPSNFFRTTSAGNQYWSKLGEDFGRRLLSSVIALEKALKSTSEVTPEPAWASAPKYVTDKERSLRAELASAEKAAAEAQKRKEEAAEKVSQAGDLRALLYEKGKPLERAIIEGLKLMGFEAVPFRQDQSEFDVVFESAEGRLIGEAEGKDSKAVNIDKLRQLTMNIHEDLQRDEVQVPAKGVLFGNGFRLSPLQDRASQFSDKCIVTAKSSNAALVATSELYKSAKYLTDNSDAAYAQSCRRALIDDVGIITMPEPPQSEETIADATQTKPDAGA